MPPASSSLCDFWSIGGESFRALIEPHLRRSVLYPDDPAPHGCASAGDPDLDAEMPEYDVAGCRAEAVRADPEHAYRCVSQLMRGAGIYGLPSLESPGRRSAPVLLSVTPASVGDRVGGVLELTRVDAPRVLLWRALGDIEVLGHAVDDLAILYRIESPAPGWSRLTVRTRLRAAGLTPSVLRYLLNVLDVALIAPQVGWVRRLAEERGPAPTPMCCVGQAAPFVPASDVRRVGRS